MKILKLLALFLLPVVIASASISAYTNASLTATAVQAALPATGAPSVYLWGANCSNVNSAVVFVQVFDAATAGSVTLGTTPPKFWYAIPTNGVLDKDIMRGIYFQNGIVIAVTTTPTGNTAPSTACPISLFYE